MKAASSQIASILRRPVQYVGLLIYGQEWGLVRERARLAINAVLGEARDPFRFAALAREDHAKLPAEAESLALGGGRRVVHVFDAADSLASVLASLHVRAEDVLLVVEAGELTPRSKLRSFAERDPAWASVACYPADAGSIPGEIAATLKQAGLTATPDALAYLAEELSGESVIRRAELEKLALYAVDRGVVDLDTARLCCSTSLETSLSAAVSEAMTGRPPRCDALLAELASEGATGAGLLAVMSLQVHRLLKIRLLMDGGQSATEACRSVSPPVYPRQLPGVIEELRYWSVTRLEALGRAIREADQACKRAGSPDFAIAARLLMVIAMRSSPR